MNTTDFAGIAVVVIAIAIIGAVMARIATQRRALQERFGDEYDRVVAETHDRTAAEAELRKRERLHAELQLNDLSPDARARFVEAWTDVQGEFVDDPAAAVREADRLVTQIVADRGYPVVDYRDRLAHLSVGHARVLHHYREAHEISLRNDARRATTEELRRALVHYRALVSDLLGDESLNHATAAPRSAASNPAPATPSEAGPETEPAANADRTVIVDRANV